VGDADASNKHAFSFLVACFINFGSCILAALYYYFMVVDNVSKIAIN